MMNIVLSVLILIFSSHMFQCGDAVVQNYETFVIGEWEGVVSDELMIEGVRKTYSIHVRVRLERNGGYEIEEHHPSDPDKKSRQNGKYRFVAPRTIELSGLDERLDVNRISNDEMSLEVNSKESLKKDMPIFVSLKLKRIRWQ